jgi:hypothetical protein
VPRFTEAFVHRAVRRYLGAAGWTLLAGQWPGGSDDSLHVLYIVDPTLARDDSPDPRRHSLDKFVPDLVAIKDGVLMIVEAKPRYAASDYDKLGRLLGERRIDLDTALTTFGQERGFPQLACPKKLDVRPTLAFGSKSCHPPVAAPWVFLVVDESAGTVTHLGGLP